MSQKNGMASLPGDFHPEPYSRISGIITHSVRNDFTGFASAAFIAWKLTVASVINRAILPVIIKTHNDIDVR